MKFRDYLFLVLLELIITLVVVIFQPVPGYMDADYYYAGGVEIASGKGFSEPYLWNYLDHPSELPHPSFSYWMPLVSILVSAFPAIIGINSWFTARVPFLIIALIIPPLTARLAYNLTRQRLLAIISGLLAVFSGFYFTYLTTSDSFGLYMLLGGLFILLVSQYGPILKLTGWVAFILGFLAGLMHLSRADGLLWILLTFICIIYFRPPGRDLQNVVLSCLAALAGYLLVMTPWFIRNINIFGSILAPNGSSLLWLTSYDQIFSYPAEQISMSAWWQTGILEILRVRLWALGLNLATTLSVQGGIFLLPLIFVGIGHYWKTGVAKFVVLAWLITFIAMTVVFPFAGARGGFFHSGAALQMIWWVFAAVGLQRFIQWGGKHRQWNESVSKVVFSTGLVGLAFLLTIAVMIIRIPSWNSEFSMYKKVDQFITSKSLNGDNIVIVSNPPGYFLASNSPAIAIPDGNIDTIFALRDKYGAGYLILEKGSLPKGLEPIYMNPEEFSNLDYLGEVESVRVFQILP